MPAISYRLTLDSTLAIGGPSETMLQTYALAHGSSLGGAEAWKRHIRALFAAIASDPQRLRRYIQIEVYRHVAIDAMDGLWDDVAPDVWFENESVRQGIVDEAARAAGPATEQFVRDAHRDGLWSERLGVLDASFESAVTAAAVEIRSPTVS